MDELTLHLTGAAPLLMHRPVTVNPLDPATQEIKKYTGKRKKTLEDHEVIMRLEWEAGLYYADDVGTYIPAANVQTCLRDSGKLTKQGAAVTRAVTIPEDKLPLQFRGQGSSVQELWDAGYKDYRVVGNQQNAVMRCRPLFPEWRLTVPVLVEGLIVDPGDLVAIAEQAGQMIGLGDYRPRFGRFTVEA